MTPKSVLSTTALSPSFIDKFGIGGQSLRGNPQGRGVGAVLGGPVGGGYHLLCALAWSTGPKQAARPPIVPRYNLRENFTIKPKAPCQLYATVYRCRKRRAQRIQRRR